MRAQAVIPERSPLVGTRLDSGVWREGYSATVLALRPCSQYNGLRGLDAEAQSRSSSDLKVDADADVEEGRDRQLQAQAEVSDSLLAIGAVNREGEASAVGVASVTAIGDSDGDNARTIASDGDVAVRIDGREQTPASTVARSGDGAGKLPVPSTVVGAGRTGDATVFASIADTAQCFQPSYRLRAGDSIVMEAPQALARAHKHSSHFALLRVVDDSKPPITTSFVDQYVARMSLLQTLASLSPRHIPSPPNRVQVPVPRMIRAFASHPLHCAVLSLRFRLFLGGAVLICIVTLTAVDEMPLLTAATAGVLIMMCVKSITVEEMFESTRPRVLLVIVGSIAIGNALDETGIVAWIARFIVDITKSGGVATSWPAAVCLLVALDWLLWWVALAVSLMTFCVTTCAGDYWLLFGVSLLCGILSFLIGSNSTVVIVFHIAVEVRCTQLYCTPVWGWHWRVNGVLHNLHFLRRGVLHVLPQAHELVPTVSIRQYAVMMLMAVSTCFSSPLGFVTSIMVRDCGPSR
jgi:hypothetical protein